MSNTSTDTVTLNLDGTFAAAAGTAAGAAEKLAEGLEKVGKAPKQTAGIDHVKQQMDQIAAVQAKIAAFDPARTRELDKQEKLLAKMKADAEGITTAQNKANYAKDNAAAMADLKAGAAGAFAVAVAGAKALHDQIVELRHEAQAFIGEWGAWGANKAIDQTSKKELQRGIGARVGGDYGKSRDASLKMGIDPDAAWETTKKLLGDKFDQKEIPGFLKIKAGMDLAGQNGEGFITEIQKLKLEPKIKSSDIDRLYKMGIDSKAVYADLAKRIGTDVPTAMAKVKAGTVDTGEAIKSITKVANEKFGGLTDILGNTIPGLLARLKGRVDDLFDNVDVGPVKTLLKDVIADIEGPQGAALKAAVSDLFGSVFRTDLTGGGGKKTIDEAFAAVTKGAHQAAAAVRQLQPAVDQLLATLKQMERGGALKSLVDIGKDAAKHKIDETRDTARATKAKADLATKGPDLDSDKSVVEQVAETSETYQKLKRMGKGARKSLGTETDEDKAEDAALGENKKGGKGAAVGDGLPLLLNGGGDQAAGAMDAGAEMGPGMADGIRAGESEAIQAAADMAEKSLQAAKDKLAIHSPSQAWGDEVGGPSAEGMSNAMTAHPGPAAAGKAMAGKALDAGKGAAAGAGAGAPSSGGGGVTINLYPSAGMPDSEIAKWEAAARRAGRAALEGGSVPRGP